ncbi:MAG: methylenetetrahydrofolate reductase [Ilumatobacteraceae bacterium]|nr:methylenetetrahydrofolate reductase [Ilumatobacteraceae bacterium]
MARIAERLASGPTLSFEFFPPKTAGAQLTLGRTIAAVEPLKPDFVSVTYGAGGSDRHRTGDVVTWMRRETDLEPMAHLTCVGHHRDDVASLLVEYRRLGVENILALGGDPPKDGDVAGDYQFASDLIADVAAPGCFSVGVAAHPEMHPRSPDRASDRRHLADKLSVADFAVTQFFFEVEHYIRLVDELSDLGVDKPVVPGVMPIANLAPIQRMAAMNGTEIPKWLGERIAAADDPAEVARIGTEVAIDLAGQLLAAGAPGIHLYTLNRPDAAQRVCAALDLRHD